MSVLEPVSKSLPSKPSFELPKDIVETLGEKTIGEKLTLVADYTIVGKDETSSKISLKNMRTENKRRLNV